MFQGLERELRFVAVRSRGPGGQNVNKVSSAALCTWDYKNSAFHFDRILLGERLKNQINKDGLVYLRSDEFRDFEQNKRRCIEKLSAMIAAALHRPKRRIKTKPTFASKVRRQNTKAQRGEIKKSRTKVRISR